MNKRTVIAAFVFLALIMTRDSWCYEQESDARGWTNYFLLAVQDGMEFPQPTNEVVYRAVKTSITEAMAARDYLRKRESEYSMRTHRPLAAKATEWETQAGGKTQKVRVTVIESVDGRDGAMEGLCALMSSHTSMGGTVYEVMKGGPGDVCLRFRHQGEGEGNGPKVLFFCRGNVAVQVMLMSPYGDVMPVACLVDSAILGSSAEAKDEEEQLISQ